MSMPSYRELFYPAFGVFVAYLTLVGVLKLRIDHLIRAGRADESDGFHFADGSLITSYLFTNRASRYRDSLTGVLIVLLRLGFVACGVLLALLVYLSFSQPAAQT